MRFILSVIIAPFFFFFSAAQVNRGDVTIARDSLGVPHIFGKTDAATAYGLAWAHAEDDFTDIETVLLAGKGMLGRAIGRKGAEADYVVSLLRCRDLVKQQQHLLSPEFLKVVAAYVQGINDYAKAHPDQMRVRKAFPATVEDYLTTATLSLSFISGLEALLPRVFSGDVTHLPDFQPTGSNAMAIHPSKTTTGEAFLAINSHQPLEGPVAWYEAHLQSDEGLNIIGGLFPGGLCIFLGTNEHLGWAHTVNNTDKVDLFQLKMKSAKSNTYEYDGSWRELETRKVKLRVKGIPFAIGKKAYWSIYGATIRSPKGVFSLRFTANMEIRGMEQWWRMNKARNFTEFYTALSMQGLPMFNIVYADRHDTIFYMSGGKMPLRNKKFNWSGTVPGNLSETRWNSYHPIRDLPQLINPSAGYLYNTNHSPFLATAENDNLKAASFDSTSGYETYHNNRSLRYGELISSEGKISYESFIRMKYDGQFPSRFLYPIKIDSMLMMDPANYPSIQKNLLAFQRWDRKTDTASEGAALFRLLYEYISKDKASVSTGVLSQNNAVLAFEHAASHMRTHFRKEAVKLGELQYHGRGGKEIPAWGLPDVLTAMYSTPQKDGRFKVTGGESYIQLVRFPKNGLPIIETVNCYGSSGNASSPHYTDQMEMFMQQRRRTVTLDKELVLKTAQRIYQPGKN
jgi:acyl-homoserine-lactone acylase